jgi:peptide/nickel transport system ATP-binding protein
VLRLDRVSKRFSTGTFGGGSVAAVREVSFEIRGGEVTSLIGESGSGKSTLGKLVLRLLPVSDGSITFNGADISALSGKGLKEYYRQAQGVFQDPFSSYNPIFRADRVFAILRKEYLGHLAAGAWQEKLDSSLEAVGLNPGDVLNKFTHELSGGQLQRLLIARALLLDIKLLVADEIISMLDASTRVDVLNLLADLKSRGLGILFITHDLSLGNYISERTIILRRGVVLEMGATEKVFDNPLHPYTQMLLTAVPQLHRRWEEPPGPIGAVSQNGHGPPGAALDRSPDARRWSRSVLHPLHGSRRAGGAAGGGGGPLGDGPGEAGPAGGEQEEARRRRKDLAYRRANEEVPPLVEVEADHFVATTASAE